MFNYVSICSFELYIKDNIGLVDSLCYIGLNKIFKTDSPAA